jgi:serine/threonine-protein kinase
MLRGCVTGERVADKYELTRRIGSGGMGVVYEAVHLRRGTRVALKIVHSTLAAAEGGAEASRTARAKRDELVARFEREARSMAAIRSEHVVDVLEAGTDKRSGRPYIVMDLLAGEDLGALTQRLGPLKEDLALRIAAQACLGLGAAHAAGVVHRDIKMANLYLAKSADGERVVKILDFGIAKFAMDELQATHDRGITNTGALLGSPQYMSPEQAQGLKSIDHRADIWSLGMVLYRILTGTPAFEAESLGQLILAICSESPRPIESAAPWVSPGAAAIVHKAIRRQPDDRYHSIEAMLTAIRLQLPRGFDIDERMLVALPDHHRAARTEPDVRSSGRRRARTRTRGAAGRPPVDGDETATSAPRAPRAILIVDDSSTVRNVLKATLTGRQLEFVEASNADEGLELMRTRSVDVVIADVHLPKLDGLRFLQKVRSTPGPTRQLPVIVITADRSGDVRDQALAAGADEVLRKPVTSSGVVEAVDRLLERTLASNR